MNLEKHVSQTVIPSRTKFQLENFVIKQHDTPQMQWRQILIEAQDLAYKIRMAELGIQKTKIEIERLLQTGDAVDAVEAEEKNVGVILTERTLMGARMEMRWLEEMAHKIGAFSYEEIEDNQEEYWEKRLLRQADADIFSATKGISVGNVHSMLSAGMLRIKENEPRFVMAAPDDFCKTHDVFKSVKQSDL